MLAPNVTVLVVGDAGVGKTSLIETRVANEVSGSPPQQLSPVVLPAEENDNDCSMTIQDSSALPSARAEVCAKVAKADVVIALYDCENRETFNSLRDIWLPLIQQHSPPGRDGAVPTVIVCSQVDKRFGSAQLREEHSAELIAAHEDLLRSFPFVQSCLECSAREMLGVEEVFETAKKVALYPLAPLIDFQTDGLRAKCVHALRRIFHMCDVDGDGVLCDNELSYHFHERCYGTQLNEEDIAEIRRVLQKEEAKMVEGAPPLLQNGGMTWDGFITFLKMYLDYAPKVTWEALWAFGYNNQLDLEVSEEDVRVPRRAPDEVLQLSPAALAFVDGLHRQYRGSAGVRAGDGGGGGNGGGGGGGGGSGGNEEEPNVSGGGSVGGRSRRPEQREGGNQEDAEAVLTEEGQRRLFRLLPSPSTVPWWSAEVEKEFASCFSRPWFGPEILYGKARRPSGQGGGSNEDSGTGSNGSSDTGGDDDDSDDAATAAAAGGGGGAAVSSSSGTFARPLTLHDWRAQWHMLALLHPRFLQLTLIHLGYHDRAPMLAASMSRKKEGAMYMQLRQQQQQRAAPDGQPTPSHPLSSPPPPPSSSSSSPAASGAGGKGAARSGTSNSGSGAAAGGGAGAGVRSSSISRQFGQTKRKTLNVLLFGSKGCGKTALLASLAQGGGRVLTIHQGVGGELGGAVARGLGERRDGDASDESGDNGGGDGGGGGGGGTNLYIPTTMPHSCCAAIRSKGGFLAFNIVSDTLGRTAAGGGEGEDEGGVGGAHTPSSKGRIAAAGRKGGGSGALKHLVITEVPEADTESVVSNTGLMQACDLALIAFDASKPSSLQFSFSVQEVLPGALPRLHVATRCDLLMHRQEPPAPPSPSSPPAAGSADGGERGGAGRAGSVTSSRLCDTAEQRLNDLDLPPLIYTSAATGEGLGMSRYAKHRAGHGGAGAGAGGGTAAAAGGGTAALGALHLQVLSGDEGAEEADGNGSLFAKAVYAATYGYRLATLRPGDVQEYRSNRSKLWSVACRLAKWFGVGVCVIAGGVLVYRYGHAIGDTISVRVIAPMKELTRDAMQRVNGSGGGSVSGSSSGSGSGGGFGRSAVGAAPHFSRPVATSSSACSCSIPAPSASSPPAAAAASAYSSSAAACSPAMTRYLTSRLETANLVMTATPAVALPALWLHWANTNGMKQWSY